jgi:hypothetical protein
VKRTIHFDDFDSNGWPPPSALEPFFLAPKGKEWSYRGGNDNWGLDIKGLYGTADKPSVEAVNAGLSMTGNPRLGVFLHYRKWDGRIRQSQTYVSKGDLRRLGDYVRTRQQDLLPVGLFIPFAKAWRAVKEFMETDGELPKGIAWVDSRDLPPNTFPIPGFEWWEPGNTELRRTIHFASFERNGWPAPGELEPYFRVPKGKEWSDFGGTDQWSLKIAGLCGTADKPEFETVYARLSVYGHPELGVLLCYRKWDGRIRQMQGFLSKGDLGRLGDHVRTRQQDLLPVGLFIPFADAWQAVKEFLQSDGELPKGIAWVDSRDLPPDTFPEALRE